MTTCLKQITTTASNIKYLIENNLVYVDKTGLLLELINEPNNFVFLSRPRRFGKSLALDTIEEIFSGDRNLFKGLQIDQSGYDFPQYPVLKLDLSIASSSPEELKREILNMLNLAAEKEELTLKSTDFKTALIELITGLRDKYHNNVALLIDEYDYPVDSNIHNASLAEANNQVLAAFYASLKSVNHLLRFAFVTGVTRFSVKELSAGLTNLYDISFDEKYAAICGFTPEEVDQYFGDRYPTVLQSINDKDYPPTVDERVHLSTVADLKAKILEWYDGYSFDGRTKVLNSLSILRFFKKSSFGQYWILTAPSKHFLMTVFKGDAGALTFDKSQDVPLNDLASLTPSHIAPVPFLFQTGYLTIANGYVRDCIQYCNLKPTNFEISSLFYDALSDSLFKLLIKGNNSYDKSIELKDALFDRDAKRLTKIIGDLFAALPEALYPREDKVKEIDCRYKESFFYSLLWSYCRGLGSLAKVEEPGFTLAPHLTVSLYRKTSAIIELKYAPDDGEGNPKDILRRAAQEALKASQDKLSSERPHRQGQKAVTVGVGVDNQGQVEVIFG
ncbi:MAG: AAA family ATPase [Deltaproteobacteria bacterium]|jgi:hypothetical protein|nr:AAA family ATPase [Deltaproteobacteria bacterium]